MRFGNPIRFAIDVAAMESVVATTAPRTKPIRQSNPVSHETTATPSTVNATKPIANETMLTRLWRKSCQDVSQAAE